MNIEGLRAFEAAHREHMARSTYAELYRLISDKARQHGVVCRLDALHFLTLNFEFMVAEPLGQQRSGTMAALLHGDVREAIDLDLDTIFGSEKLERRSRHPKQFSFDDGELDPSRRDQEDNPTGVSSGRMLQEVAMRYRELQISKWRLWG